MNPTLKQSGVMSGNPQIQPKSRKAGTASVKNSRSLFTAENKVLPLAVAIVAVFTFAHATDAATIRLFRDIFAGSNSTDLNRDQSGQSGEYDPTDWVQSTNGNLGNGQSIVDAGGELTLRRRAGATTSGRNGPMIYLDRNFDGLKSFDVSMRLLTGGSAGDGRGVGFGVGQSKAKLQNQTSASPGGTPGDVFISYDNVGGTEGIFAYHNGAGQGRVGSLSSLGYPDTLKVEFEFDDMNAGTQLNYDVFLSSGPASSNPPFNLIGSGSTAWSGTGENYISFQSNYTGRSRIQFVEINGEVIPEPGSAALFGLGGVLLLFRRRR